MRFNLPNATHSQGRQVANTAGQTAWSWQPESPAVFAPVQLQQDRERIGLAMLVLTKALGSIIVGCPRNGEYNRRIKTEDGVSTLLTGVNTPFYNHFAGLRYQ